MNNHYNFKKNVSSITNNKSGLFFLLFFVFLLSNTVHCQKTWDGGGDGVNWSSANNWNPNGVPASTDAVTLSNNSTVTVNISTAVCASLQLGGTANNTSGILTFSATGSPKLTVTGAVTMGGNSNAVSRSGTITFVSNSTLVCGSLTLGNANNSPSVLTMAANSTLQTGSLSVGGTGTTWTPSTGTVVMTANNTLPATIFTSFNNLTINNGTTTAGVGFSVGGTLNTASGTTLNMSTFAMTGASLTTSGSGTIQTQNTSAAPLPTGRTWSGIVQYDGAGQTIVSATSYNNLVLGGSGTKAFGTQTVTSNLSINGTAIANLTGTSSAATLTLGGLGAASGSWGSTSSSATNQDNTYFLGTGIVNLTTSSCTNPTITAAASATAVCFSSSAQTTPLAYSATSGSPTKYSITWSASPANSFAAVTNASLPASPIQIAVPANTAAGTYTGTITVKNALGCVSAGTNFTVKVNSYPTINAITGTTTVCDNTTTTLADTTPGGTWSSGNTAVATVSSTGVVTGVSTGTSVIGYSLTSNGCTSTSTATVNVNASPSGLTISGTDDYCAGQTFSLTGSSTTSGTTFSWTYPGTATGLTGTASATLSKSAAIATTDAGTYTLKATANGCIATISDIVTVNSGIASISAQPTALTLCTGAPASFSVTASGGTLNYQWYLNGSPIVGANSNTYTIASTVAGDAGNYKVIVSNICSSISSSTVALTLATTPTAPLVTGTLTECVGATDFTLTASSNSGSTYTWTKPASSGATASGPTMSKATAFAATDAGVYTVKATLNGCPSATTSTTVSASSLTPAIIGETSYCIGNLNILAASPVDSNVSYSWSWSYAGCFFLFPDSCGPSTSNPLTTTAWPTTYTVTASKAGCVSGNSAITINTTPFASPTVALSSSATSICSGTAVTFSADVTNGNGNITYEFRKNGTTVLYNGPSQTYTTTSLADNDVITCYISSDGTCFLSGTNTATSNAITMIVAPTPGTPIISGATSYCLNGNFSITASSTAGSSYTWTKPGSSTAAVSGATVSKNPIGLAEAGTYSVYATLGSCSSATASAVVSVPSALPSIATDPFSQTSCTGSAIAFNVVASGGVLSYQWKKAGVTIGSATSSSYTLSSISASDAAYYTVDVTNSCGTVTSGKATLTVLSSPALTITPNPVSICSGSSTTITASGASTYSWSPATGLSSATINNPTASPTTTTTYTATGTASNGCSSSSNVTVSVNLPSAAPTSITGTTTICSGSSTTLTAAGGTLGTGGNYQWGTGTVVGTNPLSGQTAPTLSVSPSSDTTYWVRIENTTGPCTATTGGATQLVTVNSISTAPTSITGTTTICNGSSTTLTAAGGTLGTGANYQWGTGTTVGTNPISGQTASTLTVSPSTNTTYWVRIVTAAGPCTGNTGGVTQLITVNTLPAAPTAVTPSTAISICNGSGTNIKATSAGNTIDWYTTATGGTLVVSSASNTNYSASPIVNTTYYAETRNTTTGCVSSTRTATALITVNPLPTLTIANPAAVCSPLTVDITSAAVQTANTGTTTKYYTTLALANAGGASNVATPAAITASATYYIRSEFATGCFIVQSVTTTVNTSPGAPTAVTPNSAVTLCTGSSTNIKATSAGNAIDWYTTSTGGTSVGSSASNINYSVSPTVNTIYYAETRNTTTGCVSTTRTATSLITVKPATTVSSAGSNQSVCGAGTNGITLGANAVAAGETGTWTYTGSPSVTNINSPTTTITMAPGTSSTLTWTITNGGCTSADSVVITNNALPSAPTAVTPNSAVTICTGSSINIKATSSGNTIDWYTTSTGGTSVGSSASNTNYSVSPTVNTIYYAETRNTTTGCVSSTRSATALITVKPSITVSIAGPNQSVCGAGTNGITLAANAVAAGETGTWTYTGAPSVTNINSPTTTITLAAGTSSTFTWTITNGGCTSADSVLITNNTLPSAPTAVTPNSAVAICSGSGTNIKATSAGAIDWYTTSTGGTSVGSSASNTSYSVSPTVNTTYYAETRNTTTGCVSSTRTATALITVNPLPSLTVTDPAAVCASSTADITSAAVQKANTGTTTKYYTTLALANGGGASNVATPGAIATGGTYYIRSEFATGCFVVQPVTVTVNPNFTTGAITTTGETICYNSNPGLIGSAIAAGGGDGNITYKWQANGVDIAGSNAATYDPPTGLTTTTTYTRYAKDGACNTTFTLSSGSWEVTVNPNFTAGAINSAGEIVCYNGDPGLIGSTIAAGGGDGIITYKWQANGADIAGSNAATYDPPAGLTSTTTYTRYAQDGTCNTTFTVSANTWVVTVNSNFTSGAINSTGETICYNGDPGLIGSTTAASGGDGTITYKWQANGADIAGSNAATYDPPAGLTTTTTYTRYAKDNSCNTAFTASVNTWVVTVRSDFTSGTINSTGAAVCYSGNPATIASVIPASGGDGIITYKWEANGVDIPGATAATYNPPAGLTTTTTYIRYAKDGSCNTTFMASSGSKVVTVRPNFTSGTIDSSGENICYNGNPGIIGSTTAAGGGNGTITYKWQANGVDIAGSNAATYNPPAGLTSTTTYTRYAKDGACNTTFTASSGSWVVTVNPDFITGTINTAGETICYNGDPGLIGSTVAAGGGDGIITYKWQANGADIAGSNTATYDPPAGLTSTTTYTRYAQDGTCNAFAQSTGSWVVTVNPNLPASVSIAATATIICSGTSVTFTATPTNGGTTPIYQWKVNGGNVGTDSAAYTSAFLANGDIVTVVMTSNAAPCLTGSPATSNPVAMSVNSGQWTGNISNDWSDAANWCGGVPGLTTDVVILSTATRQPVISSNANCKSLTLNAGSSLSVTAGTLTVENAIAVASTANLTFENNTSLIQTSTSTSINSGNITYKRNTTPLKPYDYVYWSAPVAGATLSQLATNNTFYAFDPSIDNWVGKAATTSMTKGVGYIGRSNAGTSSFLTSSFIGIPNNGKITTPIVKGAGDSNLIGNPYPSVLDGDSFILDPRNTGITGTIYLWTHNTAITNYNYTVADYATYNLVGSTATKAADSGGTTPDGKIAAGQGFFVVATGNGTVTFDNSMRVSGNNAQFLKTAANSQGLEKHRVWLSLTDTKGAYNQLLVGYIEGATNDMDRLYDGVQMSGGNVSVYTLIGSTNLTIQGRALPFSNADVVPMGFSSTANGPLTVKLEKFDGLFDQQEVYLHDKVAGVYHDLKSGNYTFEATSGTNNDRFEIVFQKQVFLGISNPVFNAGQVVVYKDAAANVRIDTGNEIMSSVKIFDLTGRLLAESKAINKSQTAINIKVADEVVLVQITAQNGIVVTKKVILQE